jgi:hypothetical protein
MQFSTFVLALAAATTAYASPQGKGKGALPKGGKGGAGGMSGGSGGSSGGCSPIEMFYARATTEAQGFGKVGQPLVAATKRPIPAFTAVALRYPASWGDVSPAQGVTAVLEYFNRKPKQCPQQK